MLSQLTIRNFALVDALTVEFGPGFNVLTGETGAGKSILIDAIAAALGARQGADMVRAQADRAVVEALFEVGDADRSPLSEWAEDGVIILAREISAQGRSAYRLNGRLCTASTLREVAGHLIDLHGQHEHQSLLSTDRHADFLDGWAGGSLLEDRRRAQDLVVELRAARADLEDLRRNEREFAQRADLYRFQIEEIDAANLSPGEEAGLEADRLLLANAERLHGSSGAALAALSRGEPCGTDLLAAAAAELSGAAAFDPRLDAIAEMVESAAVAAQEAARELRQYHDGVEFNPDRLHLVLERLEALRRLKRKYGDTVEEILAHRQRVSEELQGLDQAGQTEEALAARETELAQELAAVAARVWQARAAAARDFEAEVTRHLRDLAMDRTRFEVRMEAGDATAWQSGLVAVLGRLEYLISANPGEPPRPLARIASGGEISRVMLALKSAMASASPVPSLIFDEIDAGVGGGTAEALGRKLAALAGANQVLCVTHLPQLACMAGSHFHVRKQLSRGRTIVEVCRLDGGSRVAELARMLGGAESTATRHAEQLLAQAGARPAAA